MGYKYLLVTILLIFTTACEDQYESDVPNVNFTSYFYLNDPYFFGFSENSSIKFDSSYGGYAGIILFKAIDGTIKAFDLCCPIHYEDKEELEIDGSVAMCPSDSVSYILSDNPSISINQIDSFSILKSYDAIILSGNILKVSN